MVCCRREITHSYYSGDKDRHEFGTGFLVSNELRRAMLDVQPISAGVCRLCIRGHIANISLICVHDPQKERDNKEKDYTNSLEEGMIVALCTISGLCSVISMHRLERCHSSHLQQKCTAYMTESMLMVS